MTAKRIRNVMRETWKDEIGEADRGDSGGGGGGRDSV